MYWACLTRGGQELISVHTLLFTPSLFFWLERMNKETKWLSLMAVWWFLLYPQKSSFWHRSHKVMKWVHWFELLWVSGQMRESEWELMTCVTQFRREAGQNIKARVKVMNLFSQHWCSPGPALALQQQHWLMAFWHLFSAIYIEAKSGLATCD